MTDEEMALLFIRNSVKACFVKDDDGNIDEEKSIEKIVNYIVQSLEAMED